MNLKKPSFWDLSKPNFISYLLIPFSIPIILNNFFFNSLKKKNQQSLKLYVWEIFILVVQEKLHSL